ncbi:unnamed protein product [Schistocephalus solidus]|uniref:Delta-like protein n=1 Tax=Schistocephalus solidus TaxID=70667 RepID=A0A3P7EH37_SCHSO|nr:unnamed protein product [Schistocephalus solidus]
MLIAMPPIGIQLRPRRDWITHQLTFPSTASGSALSASPGDQAAQLHITLSYRFICSPNYFGQTCERFCAPRDSIQGHYRCDPKDGRIVCLPGWRGTHCTEAICEDGCIHGDCIAPGVCKCLSGWQGATCSDCMPISGCKHGGCLFNWTTGHREPFTCSCEPGWGGMLCSIDMKFCSNHPDTCQHGGICRNIQPQVGASPGYVCQCPLGFEGYHCERINHHCRAHGCNGNGLCQESGNCSCFNGFYGANCQFNQTQCSQNPCQGEHSVCTEVVAPMPSLANQITVNFRCDCPANRRGTNCELVVNHCESNPCKHGGICVDMPEGYQCVCLLGYKGRHCELPDSACQHLPCANGGQCVDRANRVECICPPGWTGLTCRANVNECALSRDEPPICKNGAACRDRPGTYECLCTRGWTGRDCSQPLSSPSSLPPSPKEASHGANRTCLGTPLSCKSDTKETVASTLIPASNHAIVVTTPSTSPTEVPGTHLMAVILTVLLLCTILLAFLVYLLRYRSKHRFGLRGVTMASAGNTRHNTHDEPVSKTTYFDAPMLPQETGMERAFATPSSSSCLGCPVDRNFLLSGKLSVYGRAASTGLPIKERDSRQQQQQQQQPEYHFLPCPLESHRLLALQPPKLGQTVIFTRCSPPPAYEDLVPNNNNPQRPHSHAMNPPKNQAQPGILTVRK